MILEYEYLLKRYEYDVLYVLSNQRLIPAVFIIYDTGNTVTYQGPPRMPHIKIPSGYR